MTYRGATEAQAVVRDGSDDQAREREDRRRLETVVVPAVNDADGGAGTVPQGKPSVWAPGIVRAQAGNLKKLTERHHKEWSVRVNLTQRGATYRGRQHCVKGAHEMCVLRVLRVVHGRS